MIRRIDESISVAPQIAPEDVASYAAQGFKGVINNRPDGEDMSQPEGDAVRAAQKIETIDRRACRDAFERRFTAAHMAQDYVRIYEQLDSTRQANHA